LSSERERERERKRERESNGEKEEDESTAFFGYDARNLKFAALPEEKSFFSFSFLPLRLPFSKQNDGQNTQALSLPESGPFRLLNS
jgi:hypothetical protein